MNEAHTLIITNGDSAVGGLKSAGFNATCLPIRDVLHVGPLLADDDFLADDSARNRFIIDQAWAPVDKVHQFQQERRQVLSQLDRYAAIQLWFEHDLYDQLQLVWILKFLADQQVDPGRISLIVTDLFLGYAHETDFYELLRFQELASEQHYKAANHCHQCLTSKDPNDWVSLLDEPNELFPFLPAAIRRFCQEFPSQHNGLSLTAEHILSTAQTACGPGDLFRQVLAKEEAAFMGDTTFFDVVRSLVNTEHPLLMLAEPGLTLYDRQQSFQITEHGQLVLSGARHHCDWHPIDCWLGGVHLQAENMWCYNDQEATFNRRSR